MAILKSRLDPKTTAMLRKAARSQMQIGLGDIVIDRGKVRSKRKELILSGKTKKQVVQFRSLGSHEKAVCECQKCPLGATRTKFVYGVGNPKANVMFIGEAPGRDEDLRGEPFVGRAGQLLDKILAAINFKREDVYIANILKCRPPNNRDPQPDEMQTCMPYLMEQIRLIKPKIICALGRISAQGLLQTTTPLGKLRGHWHDFSGIPFIVTYHPAALLRFPMYKRDTWEDVQRLRQKFDELTAG
ncbi:MAG: uracil-DNA glycosylase [Candidatus Zixiibacteriota bacterium]